MAGDTSRANGARSRGPRTPQGKVTASRNAYRHGFAAAPGPDPGKDASSQPDDAHRRRIEERARLYDLTGEEPDELWRLALVLAEADIDADDIRRSKAARIREAQQLTGLEHQFESLRNDSLEALPHYVSTVGEGEAMIALLGWTANPLWAAPATASRLSEDPAAPRADMTEAVIRSADEIRRLDRYAARVETRRRRASRDLVMAQARLAKGQP